MAYQEIDLQAKTPSPSTALDWRPDSLARSSRCSMMPAREGLLYVVIPTYNESENVQSLLRAYQGSRHLKVEP